MYSKYSPEKLLLRIVLIVPSTSASFRNLIEFYTPHLKSFKTSQSAFALDKNNMPNSAPPRVFHDNRDHGEIFPALGVGGPSHKKWRTHPSLISHLPSPSREVPMVLIHRRVENRESLRVSVKAYAFVVAKCYLRPP